MSRVEDIDRYLRAHFAAERRQQPGPTEARVHPFVTISRQAGTGAHALADTMLQVFGEQDDADLFSGWRVFDRSICEIVVEDPRFVSSLDSLVEEEYRSRANDFFHQMLRAIASMGKSIIVGRGGSYVTADMPVGVSLRVIAPEDVRIARAMDVHDLTEKEARAGSRKRDADRARLIKAHFSANISDPTGYDVTWNVGNASHEEIAFATAALVRCRSNGD